MRDEQSWWDIDLPVRGTSTYVTGKEQGWNPSNETMCALSWTFLEKMILHLELFTWSLEKVVSSLRMSLMVVRISWRPYKKKISLANTIMGSTGIPPMM